MLVSFGGLPGTGKTTLARLYAKTRGAAYLRVDTVEQALRDSGMLAGEVGPAGYLVIYALAEENLRLGRPVVADTVNPLRITRDAWRDVAFRAGVPHVEVEIICSDPEEHRRRIEMRGNDIPGLPPPTWRQVIERDYEPWDRPHLVLDTAGRLPEVVLAELRAWIDSRAG
ncbi:MAG TPA: AAA family ATPase [Aliidongia sp.]|nr:AAA family ATPase [Aliidongia sp.]